MPTRRHRPSRSTPAPASPPPADPARRPAPVPRPSPAAAAAAAGLLGTPAAGAVAIRARAGAGSRLRCHPATATPDPLYAAQRAPVGGASPPASRCSSSPASPPRWPAANTASARRPARHHSRNRAGHRRRAVPLPALDPVPVPKARRAAGGRIAPRSLARSRRAAEHTAGPLRCHGVISGLAANGIPTVALNAYRVAAARMDNVDPAAASTGRCSPASAARSPTTAASRGAVLHADGISTPRIIGPALDGVHWDYVPAPANGLAARR